MTRTRGEGGLLHPPEPLLPRPPTTPPQPGGGGGRGGASERAGGRAGGGIASEQAGGGSGPSRSKKCDADISGVERVEGGGYGESKRDEPGSTKMYRCGKVALSTAVSHVTAPLRDDPL